MFAIVMFATPAASNLARAANANCEESGNNENSNSNNSSVSVNSNTNKLQIASSNEAIYDFYRRLSAIFEETVLKSPGYRRPPGYESLRDTSQSSFSIRDEIPRLSEISRGIAPTKGQRLFRY